MVLGLSVPVLVLLAVVVVVGAAMQGLVGLGLNLVSAPVVTLAAPSLMPELLLVLAVLLPLLILAGSREEIDWSGLAWVVPARIPGTLLGVLFLALFPERAVAITVAVMVLLAVVLSLAPFRVPVRRDTLTVAGVLSGLAGTATSIGGPPVALLYQHRSPQQIRSTLAVVLTAGAGISLAGLALSGHFDPHTLPLAAILTPCLVLGAWAGARLQRVLHDHHVRYAVLAICAASALVLLARELFRA